LNLWLLTLCWSHVKIMLKTKKCLSNWTLDWYVSYECQCPMSDTGHAIDEACPGFIFAIQWNWCNCNSDHDV